MSMALVSVAKSRCCVPARLLPGSQIAEALALTCSSFFNLNTFETVFVEQITPVGTEMILFWHML